MSRRRIILVQLPIPQPGLEPAKGNVPLAAGYLKLYARSKGLDEHYQIDILDPKLANRLSDQGLVEYLHQQNAWMIGFTCYLWNINRSLWIAEQLKKRRREVLTIVGGPEITADNQWVLQADGLDFAAIGEGEQTFSELLSALLVNPLPVSPIAGLYITSSAYREFHSQGKVPASKNATADLTIVSPAEEQMPLFRKPLPNLNEISSPYLAGILDAADEQMLLLETIRGCIFKCKFCYYPKSYDALYFVSRDKIVANLKHAEEHGAREVVLLDPTLNQRKDFAEFTRLLAQCNPDRKFNYFGELRAEGITLEIAELLAAANFTEVEIGLQSIDPLAQELMDRKNNIRAFEKGVRALKQAGIKVKVDLIIGLPGDTKASIRRSMQYLHDSELFDLVQVFNLAILPGTAFRQEAQELGLQFQPTPPYYVLTTPTLETADFYELMGEAEELFQTEFDPLLEPELPDLSNGNPDSSIASFRNANDSNSDSVQLILNSLAAGWYCDLDASGYLSPLPDSSLRAQAFTLWFTSERFGQYLSEIEQAINVCLCDNPHTTLQVVLQPRNNVHEISVQFLDVLLRCCFKTTSYLDRFYSMAPGRRKGAKRVILLLDWSFRTELSTESIDDLGEYTDIVWQNVPDDIESESFAEFEHLAG